MRYQAIGTDIDLADHELMTSRAFGLTELLELFSARYVASAVCECAKVANRLVMNQNFFFVLSKMA